MTSRLPEPASRSPQAPDGRVIKHGRPEGSEHVAIAIRDDVVRVTRGRPNCWVSVHEIAGSACMRLPSGLASTIRSLTRPCTSQSTEGG